MSSAETVVLGYLISRPRDAARLMLELRAEYFHGAERRLFMAVYEAVLEGLEPDALTMSDRVPQLSGAIASCTGVATANVDYHARQLRNEFGRTWLTAQARDLVTELEAGGDPSEAFGRFLSSGEAMVTERRRDRAAQIEALRADIHRAYANPGKMTGLSFALRGLDELTNGLAPGSLWTLAALTSIGKSAYAHYLSAALAASGVPVLLVSTEMSAELVWTRIAAIVTGINAGNVARPASGEMLGRVDRALEELSAIPLEVEDSSNRFDDIRVRIRVDHLRRRTRLVVVDYLQQLVPPDDRVARYLQLQTMVESLKALAMELKIAILVLAQLNDAAEVRSEKGAPPSLSTLRESRAIAHASDGVLVLERRRDERGRIDDNGTIHLLKQRSGPTGAVDIRFNPGTFQFEESR